MTTTLNQNEQDSDDKRAQWKTRSYALGTLIGAALGFLSAYLFAREAEENDEIDDQPDIPPSVLLGLALSIVSLIRQIAEMGRGKKK